MNKTAIAFYLPAFLNYSETFIYKLAKGIKKYKVMIICQERRNSNYFPFASVIVVKNRTDLRKALLVNNIRLIHAQFGLYGAEIADLAHNLQIPLITHFRGQDAYQLARRFFIRLAYKNLFKKGSLFLTVSEHLKNHLIKLGCSARKIKVYYGGIDLAQFKFKKRNFKIKKEYKVLMCGRLVEKKGYGLGLKALADLPVQINIVGDGPDKEKLKKIARGLKVKFLGSLPYPEIKKYLANSDFLLAPYQTSKNGDSEGIPNIIKEAMAVGLPVVTTKHSGIPELIKDGLSGYLAEEKDLAKLTEKIKKCINNYEKNKKFVLSARKKIEQKFDLIKQVNTLEKIYREIIGA